MNERLKVIIDLIIKADNTIEKNIIFENFFNKSENIKIFLFDEKHSNINESFKNREINGYKIFGPTDYTKMWILDSNHIGESYRELKVGKVVHFDLNILTYLNRLLNDYRQNIQKNEFLDYLNFLKNNQFNYNITTALMERSMSVLSSIDKNIWSEIILSYVKFSNIKFDINEPDIFLLSEADYSWAKGMYYSLLECRNQPDVKYTALCCLLLKAFLVKQDKKIKNKLEVILQYSLDVLNVYLELETVLINFYLESDKSIEKTFQKIQGYSKKTVERILNTVWDIYHVRLMEQSFFLDNSDKEEIFLPYFSSRDDAFNELSKINQIKIFVINDGRPFVIRDMGIKDICNDEFLLNKIECETSKRENNVNKIDFENEKSKLINEIDNGQKLFFGV
ncbi:hypothetical protein [Bacillus pumilus]|uniref:hypothetical protein n=1 Tax=Bacillus pumilus TaxID=1408 RepID=UPI00203A81B8|nr:hypothetical protein [Bacillus pumilus]MCM3149870.1 hypothetical protein [Bacillus pumilus]